MASAEQIAEWKQLHGSVYSVNERGVEYIFRALTFAEYNHITDNQTVSSAEVEDSVVAVALLSPLVDNFDSLSAGLVTELAEEVLNVSGYGDPKHAKAVLDTMREQAGSVLGLMKAFVLVTMPTYNPDDLEQFNFNKLAELVALAERIIQVRQAYYPVISEGVTVKLDVIDPEEEQAQAAADKQKTAMKGRPKDGQAAPNDPIAQKLKAALG